MSCNYHKVLNLAKIGMWDKAHQLVQSYSDQWSCQIHAYLHRVEGDLSNAQYWYNRAKVEMPDNTLEEEFNRLYLLVNSAT
jgi:hypothetical protein